MLRLTLEILSFFFFQAEDGIRDLTVTGVQTCALPISLHSLSTIVPRIRRNRVRGFSYFAPVTSHESPVTSLVVRGFPRSSGAVSCELSAVDSANSCRMRSSEKRRGEGGSALAADAIFWGPSLSARAGESLSRPESVCARPYSPLSRRESTPRHPAKAAPDSFQLDNVRNTCPGLRFSIETGRIPAAGRYSVDVSQSFSSYCFRSRGVVLRALIILMPSVLSACATIRTRLPLDIPTVRKRCSDEEWSGSRSEEHTSELQSQSNLV